MREVLEQFNAAVARTGGVALLVLYPLIPLLLVYGGLQAVGRSLWSAGTRRKRHAMARRILASPKRPGDEFYRDIAKRALLD